ncbi:MAG: DNA translocase FtsK 4TM domain-containing protein [Bdellovibrionales bacterium]|nr:DNA translocase FtsK 4TM domain-containing protein [Bdellovibrionales bacterium]
MGRKKDKKIRQKREKKPQHSQALRDLLGFVLFGMALFTGLSLWSYHPNDPSLSTYISGQELVHNIGGLWGSYVADVLMQIFGYASYFLPLYLFVCVWAVVFSPHFLSSSRRVFGLVILSFSTTFLGGLAQPNPEHMPYWGGALGMLYRNVGINKMGFYGALVLASTLMMISFRLSFGLSISLMVKVLTRFGQACVRSLKELCQKSWNLMQDFYAMLASIASKEGRKIEQSMEQVFQSQENVIPIKQKLRIQNSKEKKIQEAKKEKEQSLSLEDGIKSLKNLSIVFPNKKEKLDEHSNLPSRERTTTEVEEKNTSVFTLPDVDLLDDPKVEEIKIDKNELLENAHILENKLKDFGVHGKVVEVQPGPVVTMYEFEPAPGVKVNQITRLNDDLTLALKAMSVRIALLPGKAVIGIEVANRKRQVVYFKEIIGDSIFTKRSSKLSFAIGKDISGMPFVGDLRKMPHLLVAGATGAGKSVSINSMICSVLYKSTPEDVRMILVDPKMLELSLYDHIPHLLLPVVTDPRKASAALRWAVSEMERRYRMMAHLGVRNIEGYNVKVLEYLKNQSHTESQPAFDGLAQEDKVSPDEHTGKLPFIMIVIDELADLMMVAGREVEESIIRLAQMARAAGIHLLLATQRPSVDVITGVIKANMPSRISFQVSSKIDSRTILDANGAELLLGAGDMLFLPPGTSKIERIHGAFVTDEEVERITSFWKKQANPEYNEEILKPIDDEHSLSVEGDSEEDQMYYKALELVRDHGQASISMIQRRLRIGYNRAARLVERMDDEGFLAPGESGKPREILQSRFQG